MADIQSERGDNNSALIRYLGFEFTIASGLGLAIAYALWKSIVHRRFLGEVDQTLLVSIIFGLTMACVYSTLLSQLFRPYIFSKIADVLQTTLLIGGLSVITFTSIQIKRILDALHTR